MLLDVHGLAGVRGVVPCDRHCVVNMGRFGSLKVEFVSAVEKPVKIWGGIPVKNIMVTCVLHMLHILASYVNII
jgi:hypothetical protein